MFLKEFREKIGLSQKDTAALLEIKAPALARYEALNVSPTCSFLIKYCEILDANANFLLFNKEPHSLSILPNMDNELCELITDVLTMFTIDQLKIKLKDMLIDEILNRIEIDNNLMLQLLDIVLIGGGTYRCRPFLFLYYMFNIIIKDPQSNNELVKNYKNYIIHKIKTFKLLDSKNKPLFTVEMKNQMIDFFDLKTNENECRLLVEQAANVISMLEKRMPTNIVKTHRTIFRA